MQSIQIIDKYHIRLHKAFWTDDEIFTAKCIEMKVEDNVITCDVRITWKRSLGGFIRKCYPQMCLTRKDYVESLFLQFNEMYKGAIKEFKETYALRLNYSKAGKQLREYQIETIFRTVHSKYKLLALEMGTGKTVTSATVSKVMRANRTAVVCPSIAKWNWYEDMTKEWGYSDTKWTIIEPKNRKGIHAIEERFVVINYEMVGKNLANFKNRTINHFIVDECHSIKNPQAIKTKDLTKLYKMYPDAKITLLSGTPWTNRVTDLYSYLKLCKHPLGLLSKKYFEDTYAIKNGSKVVGTKNMDDLRLKLSNFMIRLKSDDVLDLPKLIINKAYFEIGSLKNEYNDVLKEMADLRKEYDEADDEETKKSFKFASRMRQSISSLSRITAMSKIPDVVKWVEDLNSNGKKVVIFSSWRGVLEELENRFNGGTVRVDGSVPPQKRQELVNQFKNNDNTMNFLGQVKAAGVAINLVNSQLVILMDVPISPDLIEQPIKRLHRSGQKGVVNAFFTFARGTVDERLYSLITEKAGDINAIIDANSKKGVVSYENIPEQLFKELTNKQL